MGTDFGSAEKTGKKETLRHKAKLRNLQNQKTQRKKKIGELNSTTSISYEAKKNSMKLGEFFNVEKSDDE